ncbi:GTP cyclohydrolase II RibA [Aidingimonas halophila]|uniref:GTP cyclohydrolase-2 n=1 Tax=Aidingimonas halophila TaxID=574349 RepID=A0A1H3EB99_9GAMM|nr:GTP cyclohydrolase II RibA [Aidingimonas halophila]GHC33794.1 GTP cyclohydrolase-2 [Aidingimonas halophila]SDX75880.1 GTP cyclohydrolase II [Aidingimonas halophila]
MHQVERAIFDIRRGLPIVLQGQAGEYVLVQPLEEVTESQLNDLVTLAGEAPGLVLSRHRLALLQSSEDAEPGRLPLTMAAARNRHYLYELAVGANMSVSAVNERSSTATASAEPASQADRTALALMRQALLIPAALTAHVPASQRAVVDARIADGTLLAVPVEQAARCADASGGRLKRVSEARVPLAESPDSRFILFREADGLREHVAVLIGQPTSWSSVVPLRLHSACLTGDLFGSLRCDCGEQLRNAVADIHAMGGGVLLYLAQEGRGIGLSNKLRAYALQDIGHDTVDADQILGFGDDERGYQVAVDILNQLAIQRVQLLTNNPLKMAALSEAGIEVIGRQAVYGRLTDHNHRYLSTKADRGGHWLDDVFSG